MGQINFAGDLEPEENIRPMLFDGWGFVPLADAELPQPGLTAPADPAKVENEAV